MALLWVYTEQGKVSCHTLDSRGKERFSDKLSGKGYLIRKEIK